MGAKEDKEKIHREVAQYIRKHDKDSFQKIAADLKLSYSTVCRIAKGHDLSRGRKLRYEKLCNALLEGEVKVKDSQAGFPSEESKKRSISFLKKSGMETLFEQTKATLEDLEYPVLVTHIGGKPVCGEDWNKGVTLSPEVYDCVVALESVLQIAMFALDNIRQEARAKSVLKAALDNFTEEIVPPVVGNLTPETTPERLSQEVKRNLSRVATPSQKGNCVGTQVTDPPGGRRESSQCRATDSFSYIASPPVGLGGKKANELRTIPHATRASGVGGVSGETVASYFTNCGDWE